MAELTWPTADPGGADDLETPASPGAETPAAALSGETSPPVAEAEAQFFDPATLAPELQEQWKKMQGSFTKARQRDREQARMVQDKAKLVDQLNTDPAFAQQVVHHLAEKLGMTLSGAAQSPAPTVQPSSDVEATLATKLGPELAFLAPALAHAVQEATRSAVSPFEARAAQHEANGRAQGVAQRKAEEDRLMAELDAQHPGWETYGPQMEALDAFLASDQLTHPEFGSKYGLFLRLLDPNAGRAAALQAMQQASRTGVRTGRPGQSTTSNVFDRIRDAHKQGGWNDMWKVVTQNIDAITDEAGR